MTVEGENRSNVVPGRPGRLALPAEGSLRDGLLAAFAAVLAHACEQDAHAEPTRALHEFRKSVRRARALLLLMEGFVGVDAYGELAATLREVHRSTSELRDRQVVAGVLACAQPAQAGAGDVAALVRELDAVVCSVSAPEVTAVAAVMERGCRRLAGLPRVLAGGMPARVRWEAVTDGLARSFRRARRRLRAVEKHGDDETVHGLRKRIKELDYQVELLAAQGGERLRRRRKELDHLAEELGRLVDLFVLRDHAARYIDAAADAGADAAADAGADAAADAGVDAGADAGVDAGAERERLREAVAAERARQLEQVLVEAREVLDDSPRGYARRIVRAARRRRD